MTWLPIVDISRHQGAVNFTKMRAAGAVGVIMRVTNGTTPDDRFATYWPAALAAGYTRRDLAVYTFINPKRGTATETAQATLDIIRDVVGDTNVGYMLDVEAYHQESPLPGTATLAGPTFAAYIREHADYAKAAGCNVFAYTNRAFWNGPSHRPGVPWVGDAQLAAELEWLVPRYPVYSLKGYQTYPLPPADGWDEWAFARTASGPIPPVGGTWDGWQFSAGYNRQGSRYGCQSSDLDLNIVKADAWARWTAPPPTPTLPPPPPSEEIPDMTVLIRNSESHTFTDGKVYAPRTVVWELANGTLRHITGASGEFDALLAAYGADTSVTPSMPKGVPRAELTNAQLAALPRHSKPTVTANVVNVTGTLTGSLTGSASVA